MARPAPRELNVTNTTQITTHMRRITLGGDGMRSFPQDQTTAYVKLMLGQTSTGKNIMRTYTVRSQRDNEIDVDFVLHEHGGPAAKWAESVQIGDKIILGGPGPKKLLNPNANWYLIVGDMTALPAISGNLEQLDASAVGHAIIEIIDETDIQELEVPEGVEVHWVINPTPGQNRDQLVNFVKNIEWRVGTPSVWAACEFHSMQKLRSYFREERDLDKHSLYISSYWKHGTNEDEHKIAKNIDASAAG